MNQADLNKILEDHKLWLKHEGGKRANLKGVDLSGVNLRCVNLRNALLCDANFQYADFHSANLSCVNLSGADLRYTNLSSACLHGASLYDSALHYANLHCTNLKDAVLPNFQICPEKGSFQAWKKLVGNYIALIEIPSEAKRTSSLVSRECRAEYINTLKMWDLNGCEVECWAESWYDRKTKYKAGRKTKANTYDDDIRVDWTNGIHFFMTRKEAEDLILINS